MESAASDDWATRHRRQLDAIAFPEIFIAKLIKAISAPPTPDVFTLDPSGTRVFCTGDSAVRVSSLRWCLPLSSAASLLASDCDAWRAVVAVRADNSGTDGQAFALLDPVAGAMRHSAMPTHAFGVLCPQPEGNAPVCVAWRIRASIGDASEVTRDFLQGRYMLDAPRLRAVQSSPWIDNPLVWACQGERRACAALLADAMSERAAAIEGRAAWATAARATPVAPRGTAPAAGDSAGPAKPSKAVSLLTPSKVGALLPPSASGRGWHSSRTWTRRRPPLQLPSWSRT